MDTTTLHIRGMTCNGCTASITRVLSGLRGVDKVEVSLPEASAKVRFDPSLIDVTELETAVRSAGFETP